MSNSEQCCFASRKRLVDSFGSGEEWHTVALCEAVEKQRVGTASACGDPMFGWKQAKSVHERMVLCKIWADSSLKRRLAGRLCGAVP